MREFLSDPSWNGIAAIIAILAFIAYVLAEWRKILQGSKDLARSIVPNRTVEGSAKSDRVLALIESFIYFIGGTISLDIIGISFILLELTTFVTKDPGYVLAFVVGVVPFVRGTRSLRRKPLMWAMELSKNLYVSALYIWVILALSTLFSILLEPSKLIGYIKISELGYQILGFVVFTILYASLIGVVFPVMWASVHQRIGLEFGSLGFTDEQLRNRK